MNSPRYIQPVSEGESRTCVSPEIWGPIVRLAESLKSLRGVNCDVYLSDGRFVVDLENSTRGGGGDTITDGGGDGDGGGEEWPWPPFPPRYPPPAGWTTGHMIAGYYIEKYKCGVRSFKYWEDTQNDDGERYLKLNIQVNGAFAYPGLDPVLPTFLDNGGPWFYDGNVGSFRAVDSTWILPTLSYSLVNSYSETPKTGAFITLANRYSNTTSRCAGKLLSFSDDVDFHFGYTDVSSSSNPTYGTTGFFTNVADNVGQTSFSHNNNGCSTIGSLTKRYTSEMLYDDAATLMNAAAFSSNFLLIAEFEQATGPSNTLNAAVTGEFSEFTPQPPFTEPDNVVTMPNNFGSFANANENIVATNNIGGKTLGVQSGGTQVLAYHFNRKAKGGGTFANPTGKIIYVEMQRCQFGSKPGPTTWYMHSFSVPSGTSITTYPQQRLPSNAVYVGTTSAVSTGTHTDVLMTSQTGYTVCNRVATPPAPPTPEVDTGQAYQPVISRVGADLVYAWNHGEPYLTFEIYRNTVNNSATATLIATVSGQEPILFDNSTTDGFGICFTFSYTDTGPFVGGTTYYYWHKAYFDASRKSGFSIVKSRVY